MKHQSVSSLMLKLKFVLIVLVLFTGCIASDPYNGKYIYGEGDTKYLRLIDESFAFFHPDPSVPNLTMLFIDLHESLVKNKDVREQIDMTGPWSFKADPENKGESEMWFNAESDKTYWPLVTVPVAFDNCGPGMERYFGTGWFCRNVFVPGSFIGRRIVLHFEGINYNAKVWVNGKLVGENHDAFLPFEIPVNDAITAWTDNYIAVSVNNIRQRGQFPLFEGWYGQGGFLREASLVATDPVYIAGTAMVAAPVSGTGKNMGHIRVKAGVNNYSDESRQLKMRICVSDLSGKMLAKLFSPEVTFNPGHSGELSAAGDVSDVQLWSPGSPALYSVEISL